MNDHTHFVLGSLLLALSATACAAAPGGSPSVASVAAAVTSEQCSAQAVDGKVQVCHATHSATHPYTIISIAAEACDAHAAHAGDLIAVDGTCEPEPACLSDATEICVLAGLTAGPCNDCCWNNPVCGSSGYDGNECGVAAGMGCSNLEQNAACGAAVAALCADECNVCVD